MEDVNVVVVEVDGRSAYFFFGKSLGAWPTANAAGYDGSEGSVRQVSATAPAQNPRRSPSACSEMFFQKKERALGLLNGGQEEGHQPSVISSCCIEDMTRLKPVLCTLS